MASDGELCDACFVELVTLVDNCDGIWPGVVELFGEGGVGQRCCFGVVISQDEEVFQVCQGLRVEYFFGICFMKLVGELVESCSLIFYGQGVLSGVEDVVCVPVFEDYGHGWILVGVYECEIFYGGVI